VERLIKQEFWRHAIWHFELNGLTCSQRILFTESSVYPSKGQFQFQVMKCFRVWNRCVVNIFIMVDCLLVALITAFPVIARKTSDCGKIKCESGRLYFKNRRELLSPVSHIGGNCVVCLHSVGDKRKERPWHLVNTSQLMAGNIEFNTPECSIDKEGRNFIIS